MRRPMPVRSVDGGRRRIDMRTTGHLRLPIADLRLNG